MSRQDEIWREIQSVLPEADPDSLAWAIDRVLEDYEEARQCSLDVFPTSAQMLTALQSINDNLRAVADRLFDDDGVFIAGWLGGELDQSEEASMSFLDQVAELIKATERSISHVEKAEHAIVDGKPHIRRKRTDTRDRFLIPMLTGLTVHAGLQPGEDWEDLDRACRFVGLVLEHAGIDAPDAGKDVDRAGEQAQGRLRRMIKDAARRLTNKGIKPTR